LRSAPQPDNVTLSANKNVLLSITRIENPQRIETKDLRTI
jgi:hypothetical protein